MSGRLSGVYLDLLDRIPVVASKTVLGSERLQALQDRTGKSNERIAREIPVSEKTWRRWKEAGTIPTANLPAVSRALEVELHRDGESASVSPRDALLREVADGVADLVLEAPRVAERLARIEAALGLRGDDAESPGTGTVPP